MSAPLDRLVYAQNWEDPLLEMEALAIRPTDVVVATAGGGCTALSLLASAPKTLFVVDRSEAQLRVVALKQAAVCALGERALEFLDPSASFARGESWPAVRARLREDDARYWDARLGMIERGVLGEGRAERFIALLGRLLRAFVHPRARMERLLLEEDREARARFYDASWNTRRYRLVFRGLHRRVLERALGGEFYTHVAGVDVGAALHARAERCLREQSGRDNYFLSRMLLGVFPTGASGRPPYLAMPGVLAVRAYGDCVRLVHSGMLEFLATLEASSVDKLYLSNIDEWMSDDERRVLFEEVARVARPGAVITSRALLAARPLPPSVRATILPDEARSEALGLRDRAFINARFCVATVVKEEA
jgi:S-adenosylmethionine-diacylglycerol 3-amino-3-carboxypropyl transferase